MLFLGRAFTDVFAAIHYAHNIQEVYDILAKVSRDFRS